MHNSHPNPPHPHCRSGQGNGRFTVDSGGGDSNSLPTNCHSPSRTNLPLFIQPTPFINNPMANQPSSSFPTEHSDTPLGPPAHEYHSLPEPNLLPRTWQSNNNLLPATDINSSQPIRKLTEDAIYVSAGHHNEHRASADRSLWLLREKNTVLESPQSAPYSPFSPSSPYSSWSSLTAGDETGSAHEYRPNHHPNLPAQDPLAAQLWQLYGPRDERAPSNDALENLVRRLTELGLDVNQLRHRLNSQEWTVSSKHDHPTNWSPDPSVQSTRPSAEPIKNESTLASGSSAADKASRSSIRNTPQPSRLSKIDEITERHLKAELLKSPLFTREPSLERGRKIESARRAACNLAGRWQECNEMDWKAHSRSRSRPHADWHHASRSRSRLQELGRAELLAPGPLFDPDSSAPAQRLLKPGPFEPPPSSLFPELSDQQTPIASNEAYHHGLIQQLIGSYQAQQSEENGLQSLAQKQADHHLNFEGLGPLGSSSGLFQSTSTIPLAEFDFGSWHLPIKPSQHSLLGSIPGLTQDFADMANAHAEYGYIPRLVRKTSFDEILAQQHHPKRPADSGDRSPARLDHLSVSTNESMVRPNTATDSRESQYRMGLDPSGSEKTQFGSTAQPDYFDLFSSTLSPSDSNLQSSRVSSNSNSSDDLAFQARENTGLQPFFEPECASIVDRITPYDILSQLDQFDSTPLAHDPRDQWLQGSVAPTAVQPATLEAAKKTEVTRLVSSPSSTSSSSEASSRGGLALRINTPKAHNQIHKELAPAEPPTKISFSGGRTIHPSSIGEARKRSKQLPYSSPADPPVSAGPTGHPGPTHCLNCHTTETPLWRRDAQGRPLCNACGLFVNLHGTPRPAALSTGIIKRRNRGRNRDKNALPASSSTSTASAQYPPGTAAARYPHHPPVP